MNMLSVLSLRFLREYRLCAIPLLQALKNDEDYKVCVNLLVWSVGGHYQRFLHS